MTIRFGLVLVLSVSLAFAACDGGNGDDSNGDDPSALSDGESLGEIESVGGGTQVANDARTFVSAVCADGELVIRTETEVITASMDCASMLGPEIVEQYVDQPVVIRYEDERLFVTSPAIGTMNLAATDPRIDPPDAAP